MNGVFLCLFGKASCGLFDEPYGYAQERLHEENFYVFTFACECVYILFTTELGDNQEKVILDHSHNY